jgi:copper(I)-binding protein
MLRWKGLRSHVEVVKSISIPAHGAITLRAGEYYVTLPDSPEKVRPGRSLALSLSFETGGNLEVIAPVSNQVLGNMRQRPPGP